MPKNDAELMRQMMNLTESVQPSSQEPIQLDEELTWKGIGQKFGNIIGTAKGKGRVEREKTYGKLYKLFLATMGRSGQDWDSLTWKTLLNFMINKNVASMVGVEATDALTSVQVSEIIKDPLLRNALNREVRNINTVMPTNILPLKNELISTAIAGDEKMKKKSTEKVVIALLNGMATALLDKSGGNESFDDTPASSAPTADNIINTMATLVGSTPDQIKQHLRAAGLVIPESIVDVKTPLLEYMNRTLNKDK